jgi:hypothetical protein
MLDCRILLCRGQLRARSLSSGQGQRSAEAVPLPPQKVPRGASELPTLGLIGEARCLSSPYQGFPFQSRHHFSSVTLRLVLMSIFG